VEVQGLAPVFTFGTDQAIRSVLLFLGYWRTLYTIVFVCTHCTSMSFFFIYSSDVHRDAPHSSSPVNAIVTRTEILETAKPPFGVFLFLPAQYPRTSGKTRWSAVLHGYIQPGNWDSLERIPSTYTFSVDGIPVLLVLWLRAEWVPATAPPRLCRLSCPSDDKNKRGNSKDPHT